MCTENPEGRGHLMIWRHPLAEGKARQVDCLRLLGQVKSAFQSA